MRAIGVFGLVAVLGTTVVCGLPGCRTPQREQAESKQQKSLGPPVAPGQTFGTAYFTVHAPKEPGWALIATHDSLLAIGKMDWKTRESFAATVWATTLREAPTETRFDDLVDELRRADSMPPRHKLLRMSEPTPAGNGGFGRAYEMEVVDQTTPPAGGKRPMILEIYALVRQHPERKNVVVTAKYTYRFVQGMGDPDSARRARAFLAGVTFLPDTRPAATF